MSIKRNKKNCKGCGNLTYIFGHGLCQNCYRKNQGGIKKKPKKPPKKAFGFNSEKDLFMYLWDNSDHKCMVSRQPLDKFFGTTRFWSMFAHILPKGRYPEYRLNPENVWIVHPDIHDLYDNRGADKQDNSGYDFNPLRQKQQQLKIEYYENYS